MWDVLVLQSLIVCVLCLPLPSLHVFDFLESLSYILCTCTLHVFESLSYIAHAHARTHARMRYTHNSDNNTN